MRFVCVIVLVSFAVCLCAAAALAEQPTGVPVTHHGKLILRIRDDVGGFTKEQRAKEMQERILLAMSAEFQTDDVNLIPDHVLIVEKGADRAIMVGDILIITVTTVDARTNNTTPDALAAIWMKRIIDVLDEATEDS